MSNRLSRRTFLQVTVGASSAIIVGFDPRARSWIVEGQAQPTQWQKVPKLDGTLLFDDASRSAVASDMGNIVHRMPAAVLKPGSVRDVISMVQYANRHALKIAVRGQGHSAYGQSMAEAGIVIDSSPLNRISVKAHSVEAQAGALWGEVAKASLAKGLTPPVMLQDPTQTVTVGGTLSIGGMGITSMRFGAQIDTVEELDVVTGDGRPVTCSAQHESELFNMVLAGLGQCALILRARIRLVPAPSHVVLHDLFYHDLDTFLSDLKRLTMEGRFDHLGGPLRKRGDAWGFAIGAGKFYTPPNDPDLAALEAGLQFNSVSEPARMSYWDYLHRMKNTATEEAGGVARRPEGNVAQPRVESVTEIGMFVPESAAKEFIGSILATPSDLALAFYFEVWPLNTRRFTRPLFRMPKEDFALVVWIIDQAYNAAEISAMLATHRALYERMRAIGGKRYGGYGAVPFSQADWREQFGPDVWRRLSEAKKRFDPHQVLTPEPGIFSA
jgi:FAD/FMN-containing dehydrogenase